MTAPVLWTSAEAEAATGGRSTLPFRASGVSIDSRTLVPGDLFVAISGPNHDGHDFIAAAIAAGAAAAVVGRMPPAIVGTAPLLAVVDPRVALVDLAAAARRRTSAKIIGVTGSVGKTGTKEAIRLALAAQGATAASAGNLNNQWGLPLSLARTPRDCKYAVYEMGMSRAGEIAALTRLAQPEVAVITTIEAAHLANFASVEDIARAKAEIFLGMKGGVAVLNRDNPHFPLLAAIARGEGVARVVGFGADAAAEVRLIEYAPRHDGAAIVASFAGRPLRYRLGLPGRHWAMNSLAALAAIEAVGADLALAADMLGGLTALPGRGDRRRLSVPGGAIELIDDSYNASPASMRAGFAMLRETLPGRTGRRVAVLGDMLELGETSRRLHAELAGALEAAGIDLVFTCGRDMAALNEALPKVMQGGHAVDAAGLAPVIPAAIRAGDVVLVKGSRGSRMDRIVDALSRLAATPPRAANG